MSTPTYSQDLGMRAITRAAKFMGLTEIKSNAVWDDKKTPGKDPFAEEFKAELLRVGWQTGWPYCMAFQEACYRYAYQGRSELDAVSKMLNPHCMTSYRNAAERGWTSKVPRLGSIGIMKSGSSDSGHAFLVYGISGSKMQTMEANTSPGSVGPDADREGDGVYRKTRNLMFSPTTSLHLIGFIHPMIES